MEPSNEISNDAISQDRAVRKVAAWLADQQREACKSGDKSSADAIGNLLRVWSENVLSLENLPEAENQETASSQESEASSRKRIKLMIFIWLGMIVLSALALHNGVDKRIIAGGWVLLGLASHVFSWLIGIIMLVPFIGPLLIKVLSIPAIWLLNSIGYFVSIIAIKRGYSKDVLTYRSLTVALITGIVIGYIIGHLI